MIVGEDEYIRGIRQLKAIPWFLRMILTRNWLGAKRELKIISGYAKPYKAYFRCGMCGKTLPFAYWDGTLLTDTGEFICSRCVDEAGG